MDCALGFAFGRALGWNLGRKRVAESPCQRSARSQRRAEILRSRFVFVLRWLRSRTHPTTVCIEWSELLVWLGAEPLVVLLRPFRVARAEASDRGGPQLTLLWAPQASAANVKHK